jgi:YggT family protein
MTPAVLVFSIVPYPVNVALQAVVQFYVLIIIVWALISWFNKGAGLVNDVYQALDKLVKPFVDIFRKFIPAAGGMDFSPLIAILVLQIVARFLL